MIIFEMHFSKTIPNLEIIYSAFANAGVKDYNEEHETVNIAFFVETHQQMAFHNIIFGNSTFPSKI
jgi:hypothetical protein